MRTHVPQEGDHTHVLIEGVIVDEGQRRKRGGDILDLEFRFQVGIQVGSEVVELLFELVNIMLDCIREKLLPLSGASTGVSDQAGGSSEYDNWGVAGKSQMIKDQEAHVIPNVNAIRCRVYTDVCACRLLPSYLSDLWQHPSHGLVIGKSRV